ncbi:tRNA-specific adenosine deaminase [Longibacter salinarum]|uniref:tRNA-specific adenosine deaminase n=1 Tax=Longibacter salinarum TaxID=1850348 RepID=A0A2A8CYF6_9BACT|nr:nucleoside deaminase [Longibacter salinarum]PEN13633.1 tRNA-specific adenosine deaminase [Longibacter salinarum]
MSTEPDRRFMQIAISLAVENVERGGGPFGAIVVSNDEIIARGANRVTASHDPTAHAEVMAIRAACESVGHFELSGCTLYTSCEPCPMCLGAIYWSRLDRVVYAATRNDAAQAGFDDDHIYREIEKPPSDRQLPMQHVAPELASRPFEAWSDFEDRMEY